MASTRPLSCPSHAELVSLYIGITYVNNQKRMMSAILKDTYKYLKGEYTQATRSVPFTGNTKGQGMGVRVMNLTVTSFMQSRQTHPRTNLTEKCVGTMRNDRRWQ